MDIDIKDSNGRLIFFLFYPQVQVYKKMRLFSGKVVVNYRGGEN